VCVRADAFIAGVCVCVRACVRVAPSLTCAYLRAHTKTHVCTLGKLVENSRARCLGTQEDGRCIHLSLNNTLSYTQYKYAGEVVRLSMRGKDYLKWPKGGPEVFNVAKGLVVMAKVLSSHTRTRSRSRSRSRSFVSSRARAFSSGKLAQHDRELRGQAGARYEFLESELCSNFLQRISGH